MVEVDASDEKVRPNQNLWAVLIREVPDDADEKVRCNRPEVVFNSVFVLLLIALYFNLC